MNSQGRPTRPEIAEAAARGTFTGNRALDMEEPLIFEAGRFDATGVDLEEAAPVASRLGSFARANAPDLPGLTEPEAVRHYVRLSRDNYSIDAGLYPLGSCMRDLAQQAGKDICNEDILSLSVGRAIYPEDGMDAEKILSEADKRMYLQKRSQTTQKNRRLYPRVRGRLTTEISSTSQPQTLGIITNLSLGGCYVETSGLLLPGSQFKLAFSYEQSSVTIDSEVVRMDMGIGAALKFNEATHEVRSALQRILDKLASAESVVDLKRGQAAAGRIN